MPGEVIAALATPPGDSALALLRMSGEGCAAMVEELLDLEEGRLSGMRRAVATIPGAAPGADAVAFSWPSGRSYTGEEMVDVVCPGAREIVDGLLAGMLSRGARPSLPGEFTRRAYLSGRISPLEVIGLASLWRRDSEDGGAGGALGELGTRLAESLERSAEQIEAAVEFPDDIDEHRLDVGESLEEALKRARLFREGAGKAEGPVRVFLAGPVNSGKSTLFNRLAGAERAVVSDEAGTTRDGASCITLVGGRLVELFDTPGFRDGETGGADAEALRIALGMIGSGDVVVWMSPGSSEEPGRGLAETAGRIVRVASRCDEIRGEWLPVSSVTGEGIDELGKAIAGARPGGLLTTIAGLIETRIVEASGALSGRDLALAAENVADALRELNCCMDRGAGVGIAVERALGRMCVGK